jgi:hypothetical protein
MKVEVDTIYYAYINAWKALEAKLKVPTPHNVHQKFPREYNVKLHYTGAIRELKYIEFPSDADFTMFILKWS